MNEERRSARIVRQTAETEIELYLCLDGSGAWEGGTGIGFFDHMLAAFARHGLFDLEVRCQGDLQVDQHHTVEDVGICLGQAIAQALEDKAGIQRFGDSCVPMDEALARAAVDLSGRAFLVLKAPFGTAMVGDFPTCLVREFFRAVADHGKLSLHLDLLRGDNDHHSIEALFKAGGRALGAAVQRRARVRGVLSTKGSL